MKLYLIKRISDKKFFVSTNGNGTAYFSNKPCMFLKTPEGVASNLRRLCSEFIAQRDRWNFYQKNWKNFDGRKLKSYEIVVMDVDIIAMTATPAIDFIQLDAIKNAPVSRFDNHPEYKAAS